MTETDADIDTDGDTDSDTDTEATPYAATLYVATHLRDFTIDIMDGP